MKKSLKQFFVFSIVLLIAFAVLVVIFDPFYHYHKPILWLKPVLNEKEYQCIGTLKNFEYDSVIAGSSVAENYNNKWFDDRFNCKSIKAIRSYGATADLCYFLDIAFENGNIKNVFYNLDPSSLKSEPVITFEQTGCPMYLYDDNIFNDLQYIYNKDVLFERIPYMLAKSLSKEFDEGASYNWGQWKEFNLDMCTGLYLRHPNIAPMKDAHIYDEYLSANISLIEERVAKHPETTFYIFIPPYSMLWWDNVYREGDTEFYLYAIEEAYNELTKYDNVKFYNFLGDREVITNLDSNYMDTLHFSPDINYYICENLAQGNGLLSDENIREEMDAMSLLAYEIPESLIKPYVEMIKELIE